MRRQGSTGGQTVFDLPVHQGVHRLAMHPEVVVSRGLRLHALDREQPLFELHALARVAGEIPGAADHPVTGDDDRQRVPAQGLGHRPDRGRRADANRDPRVRRDRAVRQCGGGFQHATLEVAPRPAQVERPVEAGATALQILDQLGAQRLGGGRVLDRLLAEEAAHVAAERARGREVLHERHAHLGAADQERPEGRREDPEAHHAGAEVGQARGELGPRQRGVVARQRTAPRRVHQAVHRAIAS